MSPTEFLDIADGLWIWRAYHPQWTPRADWPPVVTSTCATSQGKVLVVDPLVPVPDEDKIWGRMDAHPPDAVVILKPDHVRDVDRFVERYRCAAYGPNLFFKDDIPKTDLSYVMPGSLLPGGAVALYDGRGRNETPLWLPEHKTIVFADALTAQDGVLRVWGTPWHHERTVPAMRKLLDLPFETLIISHGDPVHSRQDFIDALERDPWG